MKLVLLHITENLLTRLTGAKVHQIQWWVREGWIRVDSSKNGLTRRLTRKYSRQNAMRIKLVRILMDAGVPAKVGAWLVNIVTAFWRSNQGNQAGTDILGDIGGSNLRYTLGIFQPEQAKDVPLGTKYLALQIEGGEGGGQWIYGPLDFENPGDPCEPEIFDGVLDPEKLLAWEGGKYQAEFTLEVNISAPCRDLLWAQTELDMCEHVKA